MNPSDLKSDDKLGLDLEQDEAGRLYAPRLREIFAPLRHDLTAVEALSALRWAAGSLRIVQERWAERHGLSEGRLGILIYLYRRGDTPLGEIAQNFYSTPRNITGLVDHLEHDGLVERVPDAADRRSVRARLTQKGRERIEDIWKQAAQNQLEVVQGIDKAELVQLRHTCLRLLENARKELGK